jgi:hypothetical protein
MSPPRRAKPPYALLATLGLCLAAAGVLRPWQARPKAPAIPDGASFGDAAEAPDDATGSVRPANDRELAAFMATMRARDASTSRSATSRPRTRDPFFLREEAERGLTLAAAWRAEDERAAASRPTEAPTTASRPVVDEADAARVRGLKLLGVVSGPDHGSAVFEGAGRIRVGDAPADSAFRLASVSARGAVFRAGAIEIEVPRVLPQGGSVRSEND